MAFTTLSKGLDFKTLAPSMDRSEYEPKQFPGLVCRLDEPKVVVLLFGSGKLVCTGGKTLEEFEIAVDKISEEYAPSACCDKHP